MITDNDLYHLFIVLIHDTSSLIFYQKRYDNQVQLRLSSISKSAEEKNKNGDPLLYT